MTSSRSDVVTQFVCSCFCVFVFPCFRVEFQWFFKIVQSMFEVSRIFQGSFKEVVYSQKVSKVFQGNLKGV